MVQSGIRVGPASFHSWQHWCQIQQRSLSMLPPGPEGVVEGGQPTPYLAGNGESSEEPHRGTTLLSTANWNWTTTSSNSATSLTTASVTTISFFTTTSQVIRFVWLTCYAFNWSTHIAIGAISQDDSHTICATCDSPVEIYTITVHHIPKQH